MTTVTTCIGIAAAAGTAYMLAGNPDVRRRSRKLRRNTGRTLRHVSSFINHAADMMR
jgi:ATP-dependent protease ClpP protease subunit